MKHTPLLAVALVTLLGSPALADVPPPQDVPYPGTLSLQVDATDVTHRIFRVHEEVPVQPGPLTLLYPEWIPGHHSPSGPMDKVAGIEISAGGQVIPWERDQSNVYAFHMTVPAGVNTIGIDFEFLSPQSRDQGRVVMTPEMLNLQWNTVALYPAGYYSRRIQVSPSVTLPEGWHLTTALEEASHSGDTYHFKPIDFENLVDSPVFAGIHYKRIDLDPGAKVPVHLNVFADKAKDLEISDTALKTHKALVQQVYKVYGTQHYDHYDFLLAVTDKMSHIGLEHHRSSENGVDANYFTEWGKAWISRDLLPHEFNHSWNGKYRRPAGIWTPNYNVVKQDHGLWVYEGQTQYWGFVFAARSGLWSHQQTMDMMARLAGTYDRGRPGMAWRNILDTTNDPTIAHRRPLPFRNYQMSEDYYSGGQLIWLAVDAKLRDLSRDRHSLDDFGRAFYGVNPGAWDVDTFEFADIVETLNGIEKYDWAPFLNERLEGHVNLSKSMEDQGWQLVYDDTANAAVKASEERYKGNDFLYSLGFLVGKDGNLQDVIWDSPAFNAGLSPSMTLVAVNGEAFDADVLKDAVTAAKTDKAPIELLVKNFNQYHTVQIEYHEGLKYPRLERIKGKKDYLSEVLRAR